MTRHTPTVVNAAPTLTGDTRTMKVYTSTLRVPTSNGNAHMHVGPDIAFTKNGKCTTAKRALEDSLGAPPQGFTNWSYTLDNDAGGTPADGVKVYICVQKTLVGLLPCYFQVGPDVAYTTKKAASRAVRALRAETGVNNIIIYSLYINVNGAQTDSAPQVQPFTVSILARSQEEADELAASLARQGVAA